MRFGTRLVVSVVLATAPAAAQISAFPWTLAGNQTGSGFQTPTLLHVVGPDSGSCTPPVTWFDTVMPVGGTLHVLVDFQNLDSWTYKGQDEYDSPAWVFGNLYAQPPGQGTYSGWPTGSYAIDFEAEAGEHVGLGAWAADCSYGPGVCDFHDLVLDPKPWSVHAAALDPRDLWTQPMSSYVSDMARAGDVNLDGIDDVVLTGQFGYPNNVLVISGQDGSSLLLANARELLSPEKAAAVGDVDADGYPDIAVADAFVLGSAGAFAGAVSILSGADGMPLLTVEGTAKWDELGDHVAGVGDVDLDGVPDFAASAPKVFSNKSEVRVFSGSTGALLLSLNPLKKTQAFGEGLAGGSDLTGDGVPDVLVGTPDGTTAVGVYSGAVSPAKLLAYPGFALGTAIALIGDVNADGVADVAVGASFAHSVITFSGAAATPLAVITDADPTEALGASLVGGADVDGDGRPDVVAGATSYLAGGSLRVFDALDGTPGAILAPGHAGDHFGQAVALLGDADGDGLADIAALSSPSNALTGSTAVHAFSKLGHAGPPVLTHSIDLVPDQDVSVTVANIAPGRVGLVIVGGSLVDLPMAGGVLAPSPDIVLPIVGGADGTAIVHARWPIALPAWSTIWAQAWMIDPAGPHGFTASDAIGASQL